MSERCQTKAVIRGKEVRCAEIDGHATAHVFYPGERGEPAAPPAPSAPLDLQEKAKQWLRDHWNERWAHTMPSREDNHTRDMANFAADAVKAELARLTTHIAAQNESGVV